MNYLALPAIVLVNAFLTGLFTKVADIANDDGFKVGNALNILFGILWGIFGALVVLGNTDIAAFYFGILLSWIHRYKLDNYSHGIGGSIVLAAIFYVHPISPVQLLITVGSCALFTIFGLLSRHEVIRKNSFMNYNGYSFLFLVAIACFHSNIWIVIAASLANVIGYHGVKRWWKKRMSTKQQ
jgi:hypothetical protein